MIWNLAANKLGPFSANPNHVTCVHGIGVSTAAICTLALRKRRAESARVGLDAC
jgi:hypothetical protein